MFKNGLFVISITVLFIAGCSSKSETDTQTYTYDFSDTLLLDGNERSYHVHLPSIYYETNSAVPLVIALHGGFGSGEQFRDQSKLNNKANSEGFIVVYPDGLENPGLLGVRSWNAGDCCGKNATELDTNDVGFISTLIEKLSDNFRLDTAKVYATGHSNGAMMSYRLACDLSDKITAIAPNAGAHRFHSCNPSRPVPVLHMHSKLDENAPYLGGEGDNAMFSGVHNPVSESLAVFSDIADCQKHDVDQSNSLYTHEVFSECDNGVTLEYYLTEDGGHSWPGGEQSRDGADDPSTAIDANALLWTFFNQFSL